MSLKMDKTWAIRFVSKLLLLKLVWILSYMNNSVMSQTSIFTIRVNRLIPQSITMKTGLPFNRNDMLENVFLYTIGKCVQRKIKCKTWTGIGINEYSLEYAWNEENLWIRALEALNMHEMRRIYESMNVHEMDRYRWICRKVNEYAFTCSFEVVIFGPLGHEAMLCERSRNLMLAWNHCFSCHLMI